MRRIFDEHDYTIRRLDDGRSRVLFVGIKDDGGTKTFSSKLEINEMRNVLSSAIFHIASAGFESGRKKQEIMQFVCDAVVDGLEKSFQGKNT